MKYWLTLGFGWIAVSSVAAPSPEPLSTPIHSPIRTKYLVAQSCDPAVQEAIQQFQIPAEQIVSCHVKAVLVENKPGTLVLVTYGEKAEGFCGVKVETRTVVELPGPSPRAAAEKVFAQIKPAPEGKQELTCHGTPDEIFDQTIARYKAGLGWRFRFKKKMECTWDETLNHLYGESQAGKTRRWITKVGGQVWSYSRDSATFYDISGLELSQSVAKASGTEAAPSKP